MPAALRVALIGAGYIAGKHLPVYQQFPDQLLLEAVCDIRADAARQRGTQGNVQAIYTDPFKLIGEAGVEAVDICTPPAQHAAIAIAALEAGKHVLVEKPMATSLSDCQAMLDAAEKSGVTLMVAQYQRFKPNYRAVRRVIQEGEIGPIRAIRIEAMLNVVGGAAPDHWVYDARRGGGVILSLGLQGIDLARFLVGEIRGVGAIGRSTGPWFIHGAEEYAAAALEFENGAIGQVFAAFTPLAAPWAQSLLILGDQGSIHANLRSGGSNDPAMIASQTRGQAFQPLAAERCGLPSDDMFVNTILHFGDCCRGAREPLTIARDSLLGMQAVFSMLERGRGG